MKIIIVAEGKPIKFLGGPSRFAPLLFNWLSAYDNKNEYVGLFDFTFYKKPEDVEYLSLNDKKSKKNFVSRLKKLIGKISLIRFFYMKSRMNYHKNFIRKIIESAKIDLIHCHDFYTTSIISQKIKCPVIFTNHFKGSVYNECIRYDEKFASRFWETYFKSIERRAIKRATKIIFPSMGAKELLINDFPDLANIIENKSKIIYTGIDKLPIDEKFFRKKEKYTILNIANHIPAKGLRDTLNIIKFLYSLRQDFEFINCGTFGPETNYLLNFIKKNRMESYVKLLGVVDEKAILELYKKADVGLITQKIATFDIVVLEAMSIGLPIITTNISANIEALGHTYPFFIDVNKQNDYQNAAMKINMLLTKENLYNNISRYLRTRFERNFSKEKMLKLYKELYEDIAETYLSNNKGLCLK